MTWLSLVRKFLKPKPKQIEFAEDGEMQRISLLADEFFAKVLYDEEPLFVSDEATIWDCSMGPTEQELVERCTSYYQVPVTASDLKQPLWTLIEGLNQARENKLL